jgi:hypothetical protein
VPYVVEADVGETDLIRSGANELCVKLEGSIRVPASVVKTRPQVFVEVSEGSIYPSCLVKWLLRASTPGGVRRTVQRQLLFIVGSPRATRLPWSVPVSVCGC